MAVKLAIGSYDDVPAADIVDMLMDPLDKWRASDSSSVPLLVPAALDEGVPLKVEIDNLLHLRIGQLYGIGLVVATTREVEIRY